MTYKIKKKKLGKRLNEPYDMSDVSSAQDSTDNFGSSWDDELERLYAEIANGKDFSYDINADALYNTAKEQYTASGRRAMLDTIGEASALTGGYGSSYAERAGSASYGDELQKLLSLVPTLESSAYDKYRARLDSLYKRYDAASASRDRELDEYYAALGYDLDREKFDYEKERDAVEDSQWEKQFARSGSKGSSSSSSSSSKSITSADSATLERLSYRSEEEFEDYLAIIAKLYKLSDTQRQQLRSRYKMNFPSPSANPYISNDDASQYVSGYYTSWNMNP